MNEERLQTKCEHCGNWFHFPKIEFNGKLIYSPRKCAACSEKVFAKYSAEQQREAKAAWLRKFKEICPAEYQATDPYLLPTSAVQTVMGWKYGKRGLFCVGPSRMGKTRCCWLLLRRLIVEDNVLCIAMSEVEFSITSQRFHRERGIDAWLARLCKVPVLFVDDIGHAATSGHCLEELYHVVEQRTNSQRPIIATTQFTPRELEERTKITGYQKTIQAICNRLREFCDAVDFSQLKT